MTTSETAHRAAMAHHAATLQALAVARAVLHDAYHGLEIARSDEYDAALDAHEAARTEVHAAYHEAHAAALGTLRHCGYAYEVAA